MKKKKIDILGEEVLKEYNKLLEMLSDKQIEQLSISEEAEDRFFEEVKK